MSRIFHVMKKEFIQTFRDRRMVGLIFIAPLFQLIMFGYAATTDIRNINIGVMDRSRSLSSRELVRAFTSSDYFILARDLAGEDDLKDALARGKIDVALVIPSDYETRLSRGEQADVQFVFDGADSNFAQISAAYAMRIVESKSRILLAAQIERLRSLALAQGRAAPDSSPGLQSALRVWYNPELVSAYSMVPGVITMLLMIVPMILTGMAVTRERELGTIEQVIISPIASWELIMGKLLPFAVLGFIDVGLIVGAAVFLFEVPVRGSLLLLFFASGLFLFTTLGLGLFFSTISRTQQQAMFVNFMFMQPAVLLSGFMFPIENMPEAIQYLTYLNPMRYFLVIIRGIFLKGNGIEVLWPQLVPLAVIGIAIISAASLRFRRSLS